MSASVTRILLVISAIVLSVLLFIAPRTPSTGPVKANEAGATNISLNTFVNAGTNRLDESQKKHIEKWLSAKRYDSLVTFWSRNKKPDFAAHYSEQQTLHSPSSEKWLDSGNRYYYAINFTQEKDEVPVLYQCAMRCFNNALKLNPRNHDAKIMLATCYVEGSGEPMKGISLLREVEKTDSNNVKLQLAFAFFSVKSGQLDKAIERFNKVLRADSNYIEAYLHLADAYEQQGDKLKTIGFLEKYASKANDVTVKLEVENYIKQLKNNIN